MAKICLGSAVLGKSTKHSSSNRVGQISSAAGRRHYAAAVSMTTIGVEKSQDFERFEPVVHIRLTAQDLLS